MTEILSTINRKFFNNICRLCLKHGNPMLSIFENDETNDVELLEKITSIASIEIKPTDGLPMSICHVCRHQVHQFYEFRLLLEMSDRALRSCMKSNEKVNVLFRNDLNEGEYKEIVDRQSNGLDMMGYALILPTNEGIQLWNVADLNSQSLSVTRSESPTPATTTDKVKREEKMPAITKSLDIPHAYLNPIDSPLEEIDQSLETMNCQLCFNEFKSLEELKKHIFEHCLVPENESHNQENTVDNQQIIQISVPVESSEEPTKQQYVTVDRAINVEESELLKCRYCDELFSRLILKKHYDECQLRNYQLVCNDCGMQFTKKSELKYHKGTHMTSPLVCSTCNKFFRNIQSFKMHMKRHTLGSRFTCETCGQSYYTNSELARHVQKHAEKRKYPCHLCEMSFMSKPELNRHMTYHNGVKRFECNLCYKSYYESGHLKVHQRVHTGERPFVCQVCDKGFVTRSKLARHVKIHTKENLSARLES